MKTTKQQRMYAAIQKHGEQLNAIFNTPFEPVELCKKLRRIELAQHRAAEQYCNGDINADQYEAAAEVTQAKLRKILGNVVPIYLNADARGYACKIDSDWMTTQNLKLFTDWGNNGILAPDFSEV